jgi:hypothetical protein
MILVAFALQWAHMAVSLYSMGSARSALGGLRVSGEKCPSSIPGDFAERQDIALTVSRLYFTCYLSSSVFFFSPPPLSCCWLQPFPPSVLLFALVIHTCFYSSIYRWQVNKFNGDDITCVLCTLDHLVVWSHIDLRPVVGWAVMLWAECCPAISYL